MLKSLEDTREGYPQWGYDPLDWDLHHLFNPEKENSSRFYSLMLYSIIRACRLRTVVELGAFRGQTTGLLSHALQRNGGGKLFVYDTSDVAISGIKAHLEQKGLLECVYLTCGPSHKPVVDQPDPDLVFVDGDHSYEGVKADWEAWHHRVQVGGYMAFHDFQDERITKWANETFPCEGWEHIVFPNDCGMLLVRRTT
jgi:hypothetical protein